MEVAEEGDACPRNPAQTDHTPNERRASTRDSKEEGPDRTSDRDPEDPDRGTDRADPNQQSGDRTSSAQGAARKDTILPPVG